MSQEFNGGLEGIADTESVNLSLEEVSQAEKSAKMDMTELMDKLYSEHGDSVQIFRRQSGTYLFPNVPLDKGANTVVPFLTLDGPRVLILPKDFGQAFLDKLQNEKDLFNRQSYWDPEERKTEGIYTDEVSQKEYSERGIFYELNDPEVWLQAFQKSEQKTQQVFQERMNKAKNISSFAAAVSKPEISNATVGKPV